MKFCSSRHTPILKATNTAPWRGMRRRKRSSSILPAAWPETTTCEYESPEFGYTIGECATQEDIDNLVAILIATEAEVENDIVEFEQTCAIYRDSGCPEAEPTLDSLSGTTLATEYGIGVEFFNAFDAPTCAEESSDMPVTVLIRASGTDCAVQAIVAGGSIFSWIGSKYAAYQVVAAYTATTAPTAAAVGFAVGAVLIGGAFAAIAISEYVQCRSGS